MLVSNLQPRALFDVQGKSALVIGSALELARYGIRVNAVAPGGASISRTAPS